jgi:hypothetical protein
MVPVYDPPLSPAKEATGLPRYKAMNVPFRRRLVRGHCPVPCRLFIMQHIENIFQCKKQSHDPGKGIVAGKTVLMFQIWNFQKRNGLPFNLLRFI